MDEKMQAESFNIQRTAKSASFNLQQDLAVTDAILKAPPIPKTKFGRYVCSFIDDGFFAAGVVPPPGDLLKGDLKVRFALSEILHILQIVPYTDARRMILADKIFEEACLDVCEALIFRGVPEDEATVWAENFSNFAKAALRDVLDRLGDIA